MVEPITIGDSANKWIKEANTLGLTYSQIYATNGTSTMYTCPAGKVATVVNVGLTAGSDSANIEGKILANGSPIASITCGANEGNSNSFSMSIYARITAGQTIDFSRTNASATATVGFTIFLVQTDS